jgi:hypothetical protein
LLRLSPLARRFFSALSAAANWYNSSTFYRQLRNTTVDACVGASAAMKAAVHKTIELKANREDNVTPEQIRGAYEDAWTKWVAFDQHSESRSAITPRSRPTRPIRHRACFQDCAPISAIPIGFPEEPTIPGISVRKWTGSSRRSSARADWPSRRPLSRNN